jgi:hypothetical protein
MLVTRPNSSPLSRRAVCGDITRAAWGQFGHRSAGLVSYRTSLLPYCHCPAARMTFNPRSQRGRYHTDRHPRTLQKTAMCPAGPPPARSRTAWAGGCLSYFALKKAMGDCRRDEREDGLDLLG